MLPRSLIKMAVDDWQRWALTTREKMTTSGIDVVWLKGFALALTGVRRSVRPPQKKLANFSENRYLQGFLSKRETQ